MTTTYFIRALCLSSIAVLTIAVSPAQSGPALDNGGGNTNLPAYNGAAPQPSSAPGIPTVICKGGQLTISANNSPLGSILAEVRKCTGAKIDIPGTVADTRYFDKLGPGPIHEVLTSLLSATSFNYVIGSSETDPDKIETVVLTAQASNSQTGSVVASDRAQSPARRVFNEIRQNPRASGLEAPTSALEPVAVSTAGVSADDPPQNEAPPAAADNAATNPGAEAPAQATAPAESNSAQSPAQPPPAPTATEAAPGGPQSNPTTDRINYMEQLFEQRRQMIQNQGAAQQQ